MFNDYNIETLTTQLKTNVIVFEGSDCSGKTTLMNKLSYALSTINGGPFSFVDTFKFPQYKSDVGPIILDYLKQGPDKIINKSDKFSMYQTINKLAALKRYIKVASNTDCLLIDRFVVSQLAYDNAILSYQDWIYEKSEGLSCDYPKEEQWKNRVFNAKLVMDVYSKVTPNIITVYCKPSKYIKNVSTYFRTKLTAEGRRFDKVDDNKVYQDTVAREFSYILDSEKTENVDFIGELVVVDADRIIKKLYNDRKLYYVYDDVINQKFDKVADYEKIITEMQTPYVQEVKRDLMHYFE